MPLSVGTKLGPYEILAPIGAGGMGEVYKASDTRLHRMVAVKVSNERFSERSEREAQSIAALNHPNICHLYDVGPNYLVMEYIEGTPLKGPLPLDRTLKYAAQICDALDAAHKKGITHRDLKPANILVTKTGIKLLDFGLAKIGQADQPPGEDTVTMALTGKNEMVGTLYYMSPEQLQAQANGQGIDARSDIFSFGLVLYEMLTGKRVFEGSSKASVIAAIMERPAPSIAAIAPTALDHLLNRCLAKDPDNRWQTARDVKAELEWIISAPREMSVTLTPPRFRSSYLGWVAAVVLAVVAAGVGWLLLRRPSPYVPRLKLSLDAPSSQGWSNLLISPDGTRIAFFGGRRSVSSGRGLFVRAVDTLDAQLVFALEDEYPVAWSPDGRFLLSYSTRAHQLKRVPVAGGAPQTVASGLVNLRGAAWNKDGTILFSEGGPLLRVSENGGTRAPLTTTPAWYPTILPDGRHYLFLSGAAGGGEEAIYLASLDSKEQRSLTPANSKAELSPSGHLLFLRGTTLMAQPFDLSALRVSGEAVAVASDVGLLSVNREASFSVAANGLIVYQTGSLARSALVWFDRSGKPDGVLGDTNIYGDVQISPDGKFVAATRLDLKTLRMSLWVTDRARGVSSRITPETEDVEHPSWSPDGKHIAFNLRNREIYSWDTGGSGNGKLLAKGRTPSWSPDGATLVFEQTTGLAVFRTGGDRAPVSYLEGPFTQPVFSPDGRWIAYTSDESGELQVFVQSFPAGRGKWQISTHGGVQPVWGRDGRELFYKSPESTNGKIVAVPVKIGATFEAGAPKELFAVTTGGLPYIRRHYSVAPDGQHFLVNQTADDHIQTILLQTWLSQERQ